MDATSHTFSANARTALADVKLQRALDRLAEGFPARRRDAVARLPEFDALRDAAVAIKDHTILNLDRYLERFEAKVLEAGGRVHWCRDAAEARATILSICTRAKAKSVTKGKTMVGEEIAINDHLAANGLDVVETDLGEYIIQLRGEPPSHIIAPAIHLSKDQVADTFRKAHGTLPPARPLTESRALLEEARTVLRSRFLGADVGITGANFLIAETGSTVTVTNEGNAELTMTLPRVHIVLASIEKVVPTLEDAATMLRVLARSATGQDVSVYTSFATGPRRPGDLDGPEEFHVVLLDNGRSTMLEGELREMLRCIRCGACLNHCPVYAAVGGHAYGWVYSGPMGAVLTPALIGLDPAKHLPEASTLCGRCEEVCPMRIPIPKMLRHWRERSWQRGPSATRSRFGLAVWAFVAARPWLYRWTTGVVVALLARFGTRGRFAWLPFASAWTGTRDFPAPEGRGFVAAWNRGERR